MGKCLWLSWTELKRVQRKHTELYKTPVKEQLVEITLWICSHGNLVQAAYLFGLQGVDVNSVDPVLVEASLVEISAVLEAFLFVHMLCAVWDD